MVVYSVVTYSYSGELMDEAFPENFVVSFIVQEFLFVNSHKDDIKADKKLKAEKISRADVNINISLVPRIMQGMRRK